MIDFSDIGYLDSGSLRQKMAFDVLTQSRVLQRLSNFDATLVGTFPIGIDVESSDLDVACRFSEKSEFTDKLTSEFSYFHGFSIKEYTISAVETVLCRFVFGGFEFEIFGQPIPVKVQMGYRHMVIEHKLLLQKGDDFRQKIIELKKSGLKTEPAFAKLLGIEGDPYLGLLEFEE